MEALVGAFSVIVKTNCETDGALHSTSPGVPLLALQTSGTQPPPSPQARDLWPESAEQNCRDRNSDRKASGWEDWKGLNIREILMEFYPHLQRLRFSLNLNQNPDWMKNRAICLSYFRPHLFPNQNIFILENRYSWIIAVKYSMYFMTPLVWTRLLLYFSCLTSSLLINIFHWRIDSLKLLVPTARAQFP